MCGHGDGVGHIRRHGCDRLIGVVLFVALRRDGRDDDVVGQGRAAGPHLGDLADQGDSPPAPGPQVAQGPADDPLLLHLGGGWGGAGVGHAEGKGVGDDQVVGGEVAGVRVGDGVGDRAARPGLGRCAFGHLHVGGLHDGGIGLGLVIDVVALGRARPDGDGVDQVGSRGRRGSHVNEQGEGAALVSGQRAHLPDHPLAHHAGRVPGAVVVVIGHAEGQGVGDADVDRVGLALVGVGDGVLDPAAGEDRGRAGLCDREVRPHHHGRGGGAVVGGFALRGRRGNLGGVGQDAPRRKAGIHGGGDDDGPRRVSEDRAQVPGVDAGAGLVPRRRGGLVAQPAVEDVGDQDVLGHASLVGVGEGVGDSAAGQDGVRPRLGDGQVRRLRQSCGSSPYGHPTGWRHDKGEESDEPDHDRQGGPPLSLLSAPWLTTEFPFHSLLPV